MRTSEVSNIFIWDLTAKYKLLKWTLPFWIQSPLLNWNPHYQTNIQIRPWINYYIPNSMWNLMNHLCSILNGGLTKLSGELKHVWSLHHAVLHRCQYLSHYLNQCWNIIIWTLKNKFQWNLNQNKYFFNSRNVFENVVCNMASILSRPQCWIP